MFRSNIKQGFNHLIEAYRYISIFLTILIYVVHGTYTKYDNSVMFLLACSVTVSAVLLNYLYKISFESKPRLLLLLFMEITGISFLILFTGGLSSPFIWCFLNPLLIISSFTFSAEKLVYLAFNFLLLCIIGYCKESEMGVGPFLLNRSNIILSYLLILILVNILQNYNRMILNKQDELQLAKEELETSNAKIQAIIQDILIIYEAVQAIPSQRDTRGLINIILDFSERISPQAAAFFVHDSFEDIESFISSGKICDNDREELTDGILYADTEASIRGNRVWIQPLKTGNMAVMIKVFNMKEYGITGLVLPVNEYNRAKDEYTSNLLLISQLGATFFEKVESDVVNYEIAVADEQNRIAGDIHDSVVQRLFAASCYIYDILRKWGNVSDEDKREQVTMVMETIQSSLKDLRSTIYNLSDKMQQTDQFQELITEYLKNMEKLSGIKILVTMEGNQNELSVGARKALYRIIAECTSNAIKHSKCRNISVLLNVDQTQTHLLIQDDGIGLDIQKAEQQKKGLGLYNIKSLVRIFNGSIGIKAGKGSGTAYEIRFENRDILKKADGNCEA